MSSFSSLRTGFSSLNSSFRKHHQTESVAVPVWLAQSHCRYDLMSMSRPFRESSSTIQLPLPSWTNISAVASSQGPIIAVIVQDTLPELSPSGSSGSYSFDWVSSRGATKVRHRDVRNPQAWSYGYLPVVFHQVFPGLGILAHQVPDDYAPPCLVDIQWRTGQLAKCGN